MNPIKITIDQLYSQMGSLNGEVQRLEEQIDSVRSQVENIQQNKCPHHWVDDTCQWCRLTR